jgi:hypothetical protein
MLSHALGHYLPGENDAHISLFERGIAHLLTTARYSIYYGEGRDNYDDWGRTAHESIFNVKDGNYRCPNSQQGYTGFSTWMRGLAWAMLGFSEELEYLDNYGEKDFESFGGKKVVLDKILKAAEATCDFYIENTPVDGIPYWDSGAPGLVNMEDYLLRPADPYNEYEPVDSSVAAISIQGLLRLGDYLHGKGRSEEGSRFWQAGLTVFSRLLEDPYLSVDSSHQGLLLHSVYHRPNGWDHIPKGYLIPCNESGMWGDYHIREAALYLQRVINQERYYTFFNGIL